MLRHAQRLGDSLDKLPVAGGKALLHQRREAAEEVDAAFAGGSLQSLCELDGVPVVAGGKYHSRRGDGDALVDYRDAQLLLDLLARLDEILCLAGYLVINSAAHRVDIAVAAVEQ